MNTIRMLTLVVLLSLLAGQSALSVDQPEGLPASPNWSYQSDINQAHLGNNVASAGDVNGDGYLDIIVGAYYSQNGTGEQQEGRVLVFYGSASGFGSTPSWTAECNLYRCFMGSDVDTAGDVNNDGYDDILVGAQGYANPDTDEGAAFVWYGSATGLGDNGTPANADWMVESNVRLGSYGQSVATAGDVNNDGYDDILVGGPNYKDTLGAQGKVTAYYGSASGLSTTPSWTVLGDVSAAYLGYSVKSAGDVNGDGYDDVIIGSNLYPNGLGYGAAFVYQGSSSGLGATPSWKIAGFPGDIRIGSSVSSAGDVNGDGYDDILVGAPYYGSNPSNLYGGAFLWYGSNSGLGPNGTPTNVDWSFESDQVSYLGVPVASGGDVNNDGYDDILVSAWTYSHGQYTEGIVLLFYGSATGPGKSPNWIGEDNTGGAYFGTGADTAGDVNKDGYGDILIGAEGYYGYGKVYLYRGAADTAISGLTASNSGPVTAGTPVNLTASIASGSGVSYLWDFGDGTKGWWPVMTHTYPPGIYTAVVTTTNSINSQTASTIVNAGDIAISGLQAVNDSPTQLGDTTHLTATVAAGNNITYAWDFGDGSLGSGASTSHPYATAGAFTAIVTATNTTNHLVTQTVVQVYETTSPPPGSSFSSSDGVITMTIPSSLGYTPTITYTPQITPTYPIRSFVCAGITFSLQAVDQYGQPIITVSPPITLTVSYDPTDLQPGMLESDLQVMRYDVNWAKWFALTVLQRDIVAHNLTVSLDHFSEFALLVQRKLFLPITMKP